MARVTTQDCIGKVKDSSRFELIVLASKRARDIAAGSALTVERNNDKNTVIALREIAEETLNLDTLTETIITSMQKAVITEDVEMNLEEDIIDSFDLDNADSFSQDDEAEIEKSDFADE